jgi:ATP-utilising chromatin assembly and remodelling N-terminal
VPRDYLRSLELYRQRTWTCAATGKSGLSYEEALTSESLSGSLVQPVQSMPPSLCLTHTSAAAASSPVCMQEHLFTHGNQALYMHDMT